MAVDLTYSLADQEFAWARSLGIWNVSTQLLPHLAARPEVGHVTVLRNPSQATFVWPENVVAQCHAGAIGGGLRRMYWDQWSIYAAARRAGRRWLFLPKGFASFLRPCPAKLAVYVHDAMHDFYRRMYRPNPLQWEGEYFLRSLRASLREAAVVFTNSEFTKGEALRLAREWGLREPRVRSVGIGFAERPPRTGVARSGIMVLAGRWPHKCTPLAVDYVARWTARRTFDGEVHWVGELPPGLVLPTIPGWKHDRRLSQEDHERLMGRVRSVVYMSAYEGFGMPPVEAVLAGAAPVYSAIPAMLEGMAGAGFPFANESFEEFGSAMDASLAVSGEQLAQWRSELSVRHRWDTVAARIAQELMTLDGLSATARPERGSV